MIFSVFNSFNIRFICDNMQDKPPAGTAATGGYKKFKKYLYASSENVKGSSG